MTLLLLLLLRLLAQDSEQGRTAYMTQQRGEHRWISAFTKAMRLSALFESASLPCACEVSASSALAPVYLARLRAVTIQHSLNMHVHRFEVYISPNGQSTGKELHEAVSDIAYDQKGRTTTMLVTNKSDNNKNPKPKAGRQQQLAETQQPNYWWKRAHRRVWTASIQRWSSP